MDKNIYNLAYVIDDYVHFCYHGKFKIKKRLYKTFSDGTIEICEPFKELWLSLIDTEDFVPPMDTCTSSEQRVPIYTLPTNNATELTGITQSNGFVLWQSDTGYDGPITDDGYPLSLFQLGLKFKLMWSIVETFPEKKCCKCEKETISFYTSYNNLDDLAYPLIDNENNLAIYNSKYGELIIDNFDFIYVYAKESKKINLRVEIIIPTGKPQKFVSGIKYLNFMYNDEIFRFPILKTKLSCENSIVYVTVDPAMKCLQKKIIQTLTILSKNWPVTPLVPLLINPLDVQQLTYFNVYDGPSPVAGTKFMVKSYVNTYNYVETDVFERDFWWSVISRGSVRGNPTLGISIKPEFRQDKVLRISFDIKVVADSRWSTDFRVIVRPGFKTYTLQSGYVFYSYSDNGREIKKTFSVSQGNTFSGTVDIPLGKTSTTLNCELSVTANTALDVTNTEFVIFENVVINYV